MPSTRITIALNTRQSQKSPLLIPDSASLIPTDAQSCRSLVIKAAQTKLRLKKASRVFIAGTGQELLDETDWRSTLKDDVVLLVSAGEDYVGIIKEISHTDLSDFNRSLNPGNAVHILAKKAYVDPLSITQVETTARTLPGIVHAVAQPDLHPGTKFPIGAVFVSEGWIHPPLIGSDIGCGMAWYKTKLSATQIEGDKGRKVAERLRGLEGAWRTQEVREAWLSDPESSEAFSASVGPEWDSALGTIGAGNHFGEIQVVEEVLGGDWQNTNSIGDQGMLKESEVVLLIHSGSRGLGGDILKRYTANEKTSIPISDPRAAEYLGEHDRACAWASRNRDLIALRFLACLEPGNEDWDLGINDRTAAPTTAHIRAAFQQVQARKVVDICHNNVLRTQWPPSAPSSPTPSPLPPAHPAFIHRKGAAPISPPAPSSPYTLLPLPGSRGTPTLILHPLLTPTNQHGLLNGLSLAHGAGRAMSRAKALTQLSAKYNHEPQDLLRGDFVKIDRRGNKAATGGGEGGTWVVCEDKALVWEEAAEAYKDVWAVGEDLVEAGAAARVGWCWGRVSYKVRRE